MRSSRSSRGTGELDNVAGKYLIRLDALHVHLALNLATVSELDMQ
jgi:hypothetical protein